jgi:hypothetical protein
MVVHRGVGHYGAPITLSARWFSEVLPSCCSLPKSDHVAAEIDATI